MGPAQTVALDRPRGEDIETITRLMRDWQVVRWLSAVPWPYGADDAADFIAAAGPDEHAVRVDGELAGMVRAGRDFGIWLAPRFQRQGIGLRAEVLALSRAFRSRGGLVEARHLDGNHRSAALLARLGFRDAGGYEIASRALGLALPGRRVLLNRADFAARHGITLTTARLHIDELRPADLGPLHRIATTPEVARMLLLFQPGMDAATFAAQFPEESLVPPFRLVVRHRGAVAGSIGIGAGEAPPIWYFLDPALAGTGLGGEMVAAFLAEVVPRYGHPCLRAEVFTDNPASRRLLERNGFVLAGEAMRQSRGRPAPAPIWLLDRHTG